MPRTSRAARTAVSLFAFAAVAVLGFTSHAPYIEVEDAEGHGGACETGCAKATDPGCLATNTKSSNPDEKYKGCWSGCPCVQPKAGRACAPASPCDEGSRCLNGQCMVACKSDGDCSEKGGGICRGGFCVARTPDQSSSCQAACTACSEKLTKCKADLQRCLYSCRH